MSEVKGRFREKIYIRRHSLGIPGVKVAEEYAGLYEYANFELPQEELFLPGHGLCASCTIGVIARHMRLRAGCGPVDPGSKGETPGSPGGGLHIYQRPPQASVQEVRNITYDESVGVEKPSPLQETRRLQERNVWIAEISLRPCYPMEELGLAPDPVEKRLKPTEALLM